MLTVEPCEFLPWDTAFFGYRIARVIGHRLSPQYVQAVLEWCKTREIECLYLLADSDHPETVRLADKHKFRLVDIRVTLQCNIGKQIVEHRNIQSETVRVRPVRPADISALQAIARTIYSASRFYFDPCFPTESCEALYETWIKRSCEGYASVVWVADVDDEPVGYLSCHLSSSTPDGQIGLVGVGSQAQGRGVGQTLVYHSLHWFAEHSVEVVSVVTQGRNIAAQCLYQRCGFLTRSVQLWYHRWMPDCASQEVR
jgi:dTDP-4-amino-4,6-dideoxy-D-galactose acyltransferase